MNVEISGEESSQLIPLKKILTAKILIMQVIICKEWTIKLLLMCIFKKSNETKEGVKLIII